MVENTDKQSTRYLILIATVPIVALIIIFSISAIKRVKHQRSSNELIQLNSPKAKVEKLDFGQNRHGDIWVIEFEDVRFLETHNGIVQIFEKTSTNQSVLPKECK